MILGLSLKLAHLATIITITVADVITSATTTVMVILLLLLFLLRRKHRIVRARSFARQSGSLLMASIVTVLRKRP